MNEANNRLAELGGYGVIDTPNEPEFDLIVRTAAAALNVPIALISLLDENRQWFKAKVGLTASETPLSMSFCTHAVKTDGVFEVNDATTDDRFVQNPLVKGDPHIRFYAGVPLRTPSGARIGTLCVIDDKPRRRISEGDKAKLVDLADLVIRTLESRKQRGLRTRL